jgi:hypothetical protein
MNYQAFTNDTLLMMHHGARGALAVDDELNKLGREARFRVRQTPDWVAHASELESEMLKRGMSFDAIRWSEDQAQLSPPTDMAWQADDSDISPIETAATEELQTVDGASRLRTRLAAIFGAKATG